jgi:hypothetical protein
MTKDKSTDGLKIHGYVEIDVREHGKLIDTIKGPNIILNLGKAETINSLTTGSNRVIGRMAIGARGTLPSDPTVPKTPEASNTELYSEVYRQDVEMTSVTTQEDVNKVLFVTTFRAIDIPLSAYPDQTNPVVNEVGLVMIDLITGAQLPRTPIASPDEPDEDEALFSMRTFKSVPFESANETSVTVRYTIFIG